MQAATAPERSLVHDLPSDKAARIVDAMRASVAEHGIAGSTFDRVAREAGVSRGLLHYYFGSKERLLVEVVRREAEVRGRSLDQAVAEAGGADELIDALVRNLEEILGEGQSAMVTFYELLTLGQRNAEIATELAELARRLRTRLAEALRAGREAGLFELRAAPDDVASFLLALADGVTIRRLAEPALDMRPLVDQAVLAARALLA
ncbi:MAG TPA: TetR/AcrR family transcriptional regulator [Solirubrobacteraceae bacterium]|jgi:AcrR family transcriptional regulator|nr:TetR/AcrR family transcriptional regulator [Solirubrobacteraceae bacterium]